MPLVYDDGQVAIFHGNCLEELDWLQGDVLVTDPPYGIEYVSNHGINGKTKPIEGDQNTDLRDEVLRLWREAHGQDAPALMFGKWSVDRPSSVRHRLIWDKGEVGMGDLSFPWRPGDEEIYVMGSGWNGPRTSNILRAPNTPMGKDRTGHPTPKPVALMEALIAKCPPGVIVDPFMGSGATILAARNMGRRAIGVEIEMDYCEMLLRRLAQNAFDLEGIA